MRFWRFLSAVALLPAAVRADGLIVQRGAGGPEFSPALAVFVNGKDKVYVTGEKPEPGGPVGKLAQDKIAATIILDRNTGVMAEYRPAAPPRYVYPQGLSKKTQPPAAEAWKESSVSYRRSQQDKTPVEIPSSSFIAFLAGGVAELADLCMDPKALALIGGNQGAFAAQMELATAAVASFGSNPAMAPIERKVGDFLRARQADFDAGTNSAEALDQGLRFSELSAKAYPNVAAHQELRKRLAESKAWLDRRVAILKALLAGSEWDAFLLAYRDFERHEASFPDLAKARRHAMQQSLETHWNSGKQRISRGEFRRAWSELRIASSRQPSNAALRKDVSIAWVEHSRQLAVDRRAKAGRQLSAGEREAIAQSLHFAQRYRQQEKLDEALKYVLEAERGDPQSLAVLLAKAEVLGARKEIARALATLDVYDQHAVDEERAAGSKLRNDLLFLLTDSLNEIHKKLTASWKEGRYHQAVGAARRGLQVDESDPEILYYGGLAALAVGERQFGAGLLNRYVAVSDNLDADQPRRAGVNRLLGSLPSRPAAASPADGERVWYSGWRAPAGVFYCPLSLAFIPKIDRIVASNKLNLRFQWQGDKLRGILPSYEKPVPGSSETPFVFSYNEAAGQVMAVDAAAAPRVPPADPDELLRASNVVLPNHPSIDAAMVERLTGKPVTVVTTGSRVFHPFVWERPYRFAMRYDEMGRAKSAVEIGETGAGAEVEFEWDGWKLRSVKARQPNGVTYERTQQYQGDKLIGEEIRAGGKTSRIKYVWNGSTLVSADCDKDEGLDGRWRDVFFVAAPAQRGK